MAEPFPLLSTIPRNLSVLYLSLDQKEIADRIWHEKFRIRVGSPDYDHVVHVALEHLQDELYSERGPDVLEEIRREVDYRLWCDDVVQRKP